MSDIIQTATTETDRMGRPCKYETHVEPRLTEIYQWLKEGYTDYSIAEQLGISRISWIRYKEQYDTLATLYERARLERNSLVMNKMLEKAVGYEHEDLFIAQYQGQIVEKKIKKHYPPDVQAADLYLRNNDPEYKSAKSDPGSLTLIQNNYNIEDWQAKRQEILQEIKTLEERMAIELEPVKE